MSDLPNGWTIQCLGDAGGLFARRVEGYPGVRSYLATADVNQGAAMPSGEFAYSGRPARADLLLKVNDVLQAKMKGTDKVFLVGEAQSGWLASTGFAQFNPQAAGNSSRFFLHVLSSRWFLEAKDARCVGSTQQAISDKELAGISIALPPITEQAGIADVIDTIDTAIRETEAIIAKLKAVKQGLLHDLLTRGIDANGELRLPQAEAPHLYKQSSLGWIPKGWECKPLAKLLRRITYGFTNPMPTTDEGPWMLTAADINAGRILFEQARHTSSSAYKSLSAKSRPLVGDVLVTKDGTLGRVAVLDSDNVCVNQSVAVLSPHSVEDSVYLSTYLQSSVGQARMLADAGGSTIKHLYITKLAEMEVPWPDRNEVDLLVSRISGICSRIELEQMGLEKLLMHRSGLADDLLTGRVRVTPLLSSEQQAQARSS